MARTLADRLGRTPLFAPFGDEARRDLARAATERRLSRGTVLWASGDAGDAVALVLTGRLDICRSTADGDRMLLRILGPGELVGLSTIAGQPHTADIVAAGATRVAIVTGQALRALLADHPALALRTIAHLGALLGQLTDEVEQLRFASLDERVERSLERHGRGRREIRLTHEELAQHVGASRANVSRALKRLERRGRIRCGRGRIEVLWG